MAESGSSGFENGPPPKVGAGASQQNCELGTTDVTFSAPAFGSSFALRHKDLVTLIKDLATVLALLIGALWTYTLTKQYRETVPRLTIRHEVNSWKLRDGTVLVRVDANVANSGKVLIQGLNGHIMLLRVLPETPEQAAHYAQGNILFPCKDEHGKRIPGCIPEQGLNLPSASVKRFPIADPARSLEPGETKSYWRYWHLDNAAKVVEVETFIRVPGSKDQGWVADSVHELGAQPGGPLDTAVATATGVSQSSAERK